jgi:type II restriction enzyme
MFYHPVANDICNLLTQEITNQEGEITFNFLNISVKINEKSAIGDLFQEWLTEWMKRKGIRFRTKTNTQEFPDFLLDISDTTGLLEIKTFNYNASANFDVANFKAYCRSLKTEAYRLDADYLIFAYELKDYTFKVKKIWLKKIWEITGGSAGYSVKCQVKQNEIVNIRPIIWYTEQEL